MVNFLISRPIAVTMTFIAILVLGIVATTQLPVSLMPDVDIPKVTVQVSAGNMPARELENTIIKPLRLQLVQVNHLTDIKSETRDGNALVKLDFEYRTDIDLSYIEVNEKIDRAMAILPKNIDRPRVLKASATDIPVFYLNLTLKNPETTETTGTIETIETTETTENLAPSNPQTHKPSNSQTLNYNELFPVSQKFVELSNFAGQVIRKRIEQLPEVAMVDLSGQVFPELLILPDMAKLEALDISLSDIEKALKENNLNMGNLTIRDGQYQYNIRFSNSLVTKNDIGNVYLKNKGRILQVKELAEIIEHPQKRMGMVISDKKNAITMAVVKQSDARMQKLKHELHGLVEHFRNDYPHIEFTITRDQTKLLDYSIANLKQSLLVGATLAFIVMFFFLKDFKSPLLIGITIPTSLVISLLFFHLTSISLNIISLSGLILGIGMMVDNSIIVIDNITQHRERGNNLQHACINGTNEVFMPMLSSVLTTCAVFIPLIFLSGISGALFYDQAIAITIGLFVSLIVSITILPVYYRLFYMKRKNNDMTGKGLLARINKLDYELLYKKGFRYVMKHQRVIWLAIMVILAGIFILYANLKKDKLPLITHHETLLRIDWNERVHIDENNRRIQQITDQINDDVAQNTCMVGEQQFLLDNSSINSGQEALVYLDAKTGKALSNVFRIIKNFMEKNYPYAIYNFEDGGNIFNLIFSDKEPQLMARLRCTAEFGRQRNQVLQNILKKIQEQLPEFQVKPVNWQEHLVFKTDPVLLTLYEVNFDQVFTALKRAFRENEVLLITESNTFVPVILGGKPRTISDIISTITVTNRKGEQIRLNSLLSQDKDYDLKNIIAGQEGEYYPISLDIPGKKVPETIERIKGVLARDNQFEAGFSGKYFSNRKLLKELIFILCVSLLLLYFILASQFESLTLPIIVLIEVPIDIFGAFLFLKLFGAGINLMSMIGIVVMSGIIINDSILKIDTINQLINEGYSVMKALIVAGQRRLKPILMTSLTTILALLPFLFIKGMGSDLQKPLALTIIGGMLLGTLVSLYFIPLCYYYLKRKNRN